MTFREMGSGECLVLRLEVSRFNVLKLYNLSVSNW
jgi:hypothetical protein